MKLAHMNDPRFRIALAKLAAQPIPLRSAFKLKNISAKAEAAASKFEEVRREGLHRYGSKDEDGELLLNEDSTVKFTQENLGAFARELNELGSTEVDVGVLSIAELGDKVSISADDVAILNGLLVE